MLMRVVLAALVVVGVCYPSSAADEKAPTVAACSFLSGVWRGGSGGQVTEEYWTPADGGMMLGAGRTIAGGKTRFFEFLRISETERGVEYFASPGGKPATAFKLTHADTAKLVFENPEHDFPRKITYELVDAQTLRATIEGDPASPEKKQSWELKRVGN